MLRCVYRKLMKFHSTIEGTSTENRWDEEHTP